MITITANPSRQIVPPSETINLQTTPVDVVVAQGTTSPVTVRDADYLATTSATVRKDLLIISALSPASQRKITYESLTPAIATVDAAGYVTSVSTGSAQLLVKSPWNTRRVSHTAGTVTGQTTNIFQNYRAGTVGLHIQTAMAALAAAGSQKNVYTARDNASSSYTRNANCWITANVTAWPAWCTTAQPDEYKFCGIAISPRHIMLARHCGNAIGSTFRFVTAANVVVDRTLANVANVGTADLRIGVLNADLPGTIQFAKVFPQNWENYLTIRDLPIVAGDQEGKLIARQATAFNSIIDSRYFVHYPYTSGPFVNVSEEIIKGDSGSPVFAIVNGEAVAIGCHLDVNVCPMISAYWTEVNAAMATLGGGYSLTAINLAGFNSYV